MRNLHQWLTGLIIVALSFQLVACGTILYPERKGQKDGRLDIGVVLLDGIGLLCFIIPGVIAYAVDFSNGTIYIPGTNTKKAGLDRPGVKNIKFDAANLTPDSLRKIIRAETGYEHDWRDARLQVIRVKNKDEMLVYFAQAARTEQAASSLASNR